MGSNGRKGDRFGTFSGNRVNRAIIDIGSNTVRMVLYGGAPRSPLVLFNEKVVARLGRDLDKTGQLSDDAIALAMRGLRRFSILLKELDITTIDVVATAAVRDAGNGQDFLSGLETLGFSPRLLSGEDEARISAIGVVGAFPDAIGVVADLGGGSLELANVEQKSIADEITLPLGTLRLQHILGDDLADNIKTLSKRIHKTGWTGKSAHSLYLVGGTWRALAVYMMALSDHPLSDPHGQVVTSGQARKLALSLTDQDPKDLKSIPRISSMRAQMLPQAAVLLLALLDIIKPEEIVFSSWGLREGLVYSQLPEIARAQDPLLAGIGEFAAMRGSPPALATQMAGWTARALPSLKYGSERLRLSATMLALASMQIEPNLRLGLGVEWALHKRWIGISASERAMLSAAIVANGNACNLPAQVIDLAGKDAIEEAYSWGLAIRLCRRLGARTRKVFQVSKLYIEDGRTLVLALEKSHRDLFGLPNEKDLNLLASRLDLNPELRITDTIIGHGEPVE